MMNQFRQHDRNDPSLMMAMSPMAGGVWANRPGPPGPMFPDNAGGSLANPPQPNHLHISWQNGRWPANCINAANVLEYFSNTYNPFYDRTCNNEHIKMQRLTVDQLVKLTGVEYTVLHALEPLFVIRKQKRHNPTQVTPIADYYIIGGTVYQAPDLCSVINSRLFTAMSHVKSAFEEAQGFSRYHPTKGYWWEFKGRTAKQDEKKEPTEIRTTAFQRTRVDILLADLAKKFPPPDSEEENPKLPADSSAPPNLPDDTKSESGTSVQSTANRGVKNSAADSAENQPPVKKIKTEVL